MVIKTDLKYICNVVFLLNILFIVFHIRLFRPSSLLFQFKVVQVILLFVSHQVFSVLLSFLRHDEVVQVFNTFVSHEGCSGLLPFCPTGRLFRSSTVCFTGRFFWFPLLFCTTEKLFRSWGFCSALISSPNTLWVEGVFLLNRLFMSSTCSGYPPVCSTVSLFRSSTLLFHGKVVQVIAHLFHRKEQVVHSFFNNKAVQVIYPFVLQNISGPPHFVTQ